MTMIQNAAARLVFNEPKKAHGYRLQLTSSSRHWCLYIKLPWPHHPPAYTHSSPEAWELQVSDALWYHRREAQYHFPEHFHSPFLAGGMIFPLPSIIYIYIYIYIYHLLSLYFNPCLACNNLNNVLNVVLQTLPVFICLFMMNCVL